MTENKPFLHRGDARQQVDLDGFYAELDQWVTNVSGGGTCDRYVGRRTRTHAASVWANPYRLASNSAKARLGSVAAYARDLSAGRIVEQSMIGSLAGERLGCWCAPKLCHAHVLAAAANLADGALDRFSDELTKAADSEPYRLLVTGSRTWTDELSIATTLLDVWNSWGRPLDAVMVVGDAAGADAIAARAWQRAGLPVEVHVADWERHGKRAGMIRNATMVASGADRCVGFSVDNSKGTAHCVASARRAGVPVDVVNDGDTPGECSAPRGSL
jgi:hypothetical protein